MGGEGTGEKESFGELFATFAVVDHGTMTNEWCRVVFLAIWESAQGKWRAGLSRAGFQDLGQPGAGVDGAGWEHGGGWWCWWW